jgi:hypothetical protein
LIFSFLYIIVYDFSFHQEQWQSTLALITPAVEQAMLKVKEFIFLLQTVMFAIGIVIMIKIWQENVYNNDYFRLSRKPFVLGLAGDSGAGKDTFINALTGLFGGHSVQSISGDDYHLWDRKKPIWQAMTHLNPMANDLETFTMDLMKLIDRGVLVRNIKGDGSPDWAMKQIPLVMALRTAQNVLDEYLSPPQEPAPATRAAPRTRS